MNQISVLLGAGFSRNWGGFLGLEVFEYLLGCPDINADTYLRELVWRNREEGFEVALGELQENFKRDRQKFAEPLRKLQSAIVGMFKNMNSAFEGQRFDFGSDIPTSITYFLTQFDAIFTLNQDLLLESHYTKCNFSNGRDYRRWLGQEAPGLEPAPGSAEQDYRKLFRNAWQPVEQSEFQVRSGTQPIYKLHGSSNWIERDGADLLVMGGGKKEIIAQHPILTWYAEQFSRSLCDYNTRLMVIGYGFRDHHINKVIAQAVYEYGLKLFVIDQPKGSDVACVFRSAVHPGATLTAFGYDLEEAFSQGLVGASRRSLGEIFGRDSIEHAKIMRFFE